MENLVIKTPAKINLGLNIIRKREDGYHEIETFFYPINLFDTLTFSESSEFQFICSDASLNNQDNLVVKVKEAVEEEIKIKIKIKIELEKKIPTGAGLGGGSSDAAAAIKGIVKFLGIDIEPSAMVNIATNLGADVPYFLNPVPSYAEGIGEIITPMECKLHYPILLVTPNIKISTKWAYENIVPSEPTFPLKKLIEDCELDFLYMQNKIKNDFEPLIIKHYPEIDFIKKEFYKLGAMFNLVSGSGSSVYGIFSNKDKAELAQEKFQEKYFTFLHYETN